MITIAICDDDVSFSTQLSKRILNVFQSLSSTADITVYTRGDILINKIAREHITYDIIILDIDMPHMRGDEVARHIRTMSNSSRIVFISAYDNEVFDLFKYQPDSFIPKLRLEEKLQPEMTRIIGLVNVERKDRILLDLFDTETGYKFQMSVNPKEIMYCESLKRAIYIHLSQNRTYIVRNISYEEIHATLLKYGFVESHRSCIVNLSYVAIVGEYFVKMTDGKEAPLSRRKKTMLREKLIQRVREIRDGIY